jgi:2-dehydrotetronate isomerase
MGLKYCVNLSMIYTEYPFLERFAKAALAGFKAVESHFPYEFELKQVKARLESLGLVQVLFNLSPGNTSAGEWGTLSNPQRREYFRQSLNEALEIARFLECARVNVMFGNEIRGVERSAQIDCAVENLAWSAPLAADAGVTLLIEPLNAMDFPACVLHGPSEAMGIIGQVNHPQVKLQLDVYHAQMTEGNLINSITNCLPNIGHIQIADVPGRHQPGTGKIDYPAIFDLLRKLNYSGFVGLEYRPSNDSDSSLAWLPREERAQSCM